MISRLAGTVVECRPEYVVLDVGGVGYKVQIPLGTYYALAASGGTPVALHVHTHVREDALQLFGFDSRAEREMFEKLIAISGIGPRAGLAILSGIGTDELRACVREQDRARLEKIPGIGRKTAERVLLELRDKLGAEESPVTDEAAAEGGGEAVVGMREDAVSALVNLGYTRDRASRAVERAGAPDDPAETLEQLLRRALAALSG